MERPKGNRVVLVAGTAAAVVIGITVTLYREDLSHRLFPRTVVGRWGFVGDDKVLEFRRDGKAIVFDGAVVDEEWTYQVDDENVVVVHTDKGGDDNLIVRFESDEVIVVCEREDLDKPEPKVTRMRRLSSVGLVPIPVDSLK